MVYQTRFGFILYEYLGTYAKLARDVRTMAMLVC
mgnify:CR=1 FL=1